MTTRRLTVFDLGRLRHIELLEIWHRLHPDSHVRDQHTLARLSKERLVAAILDGPRT